MEKNKTVIEVGENTELEDIVDAFARGITRKLKEYFGIIVQEPRRTIYYTIDGDLKEKEIKKIVETIFQRPTRKVSVNKPLVKDFNIAVWWGLKPGVKDNEGEVAKEAIESLLGKKIRNVYVSNLLYFKDELSNSDLDKIVSLIANPNIERWEIISRKQWNFKEGLGPRTSEVKIEREPGFKYIDLNVTDKELLKLSNENNWALSIEDLRYIREYFYENNEFQKKRREIGLEIHPTDVEIECLAQALSDHCAHRTFHGKFYFKDLITGEEKIINDAFKVFIQRPTQEIAAVSPWVISVLRDNAGAMFLDKKGEYVFSIKGETHNSPSNKEPYGGAYTGIAGIYRDILGFGRGTKVILGLYGFVVAPRDYSGDLLPEIHPRQLLDGIIAGVRDGGNKHGIPTIFGNVFFHKSYLGKSLVYVTTSGVSPRIVAGKPIEEKTAEPGDLIVIYGGRTGIDGIHGVTESSMGFSEKITMGHVQKGDSYLQRKVSELLEEAVEKGLLNLSWDLGGGGMSSAICETAVFSGGARINLENTLLKYKGLQLWQMWVSESQERMLAAVPKDKIDEFLKLAELHDVEVSVMGEYTDSGAIHILYKGKPCAYLPLELLYQKPPQWEFEALWMPPDMRLKEPVISEFKDYNTLLKDILAQANICSKEWITRQYDHEVKGSSVIKHMIGRNRDVQGPVVVLRPILGRREGIAITQTLNPVQSKIDTYWMTLNIMCDAISRVVSIGGLRVKNGTFERIGAVDNFCWPEIRYSKDNPDAKYKAAQLIRSLEALRDFQKEFKIPLLSGKDSMYIDGWVEGKFGERHRISGLPCLQITLAGSIDDINKCQTLDFKFPEDLIYIIGETDNELGASEFYEMFGYTGFNIPKPDLEELKKKLIAVSEIVEKEIPSAACPITRGGFIVDVAKMAIAGDLGAEIDLRKMPRKGNVEFNYQLLFSETTGRFIITIAPNYKDRLETILKKHNCKYAKIGTVLKEKILKVIGLNGEKIIEEKVENLRESYKRRFGDLI